MASSERQGNKSWMSEPSKRKRRTNKMDFTDSDEEEQMYHLVLFDCDKSYAIAKDENVRFLSESDNKVRVRHLGKWYEAKLLKSGTHQYILKKARLYQHDLDIDTHNEEDSNKRLKRMESEWNLLKSSKLSPTESSSQARSSSPTKSPSPSKATTSSKPSTSKISVTRKKSSIIQPPANSLTSSSDPQEHMELDNAAESDCEAENYLAALMKERMARKALQRQVDEMRETMEALRVDIGQVKEDHAEVSNRVEYQGKDLVRDFHGKNLVRYALSLVDHLFTHEELMENVLEDSNKTMRGSLEHQRVSLLKEALTVKYGLKGEKLDKAWNTIKNAVNQKGRNLKFKISVKGFLLKNFKRNGNDGGNDGNDEGSTGGHGMAAAAA